jgi:hypothetical protein
MDGRTHVLWVPVLGSGRFGWRASYDGKMEGDYSFRSKTPTVPACTTFREGVIKETKKTRGAAMSRVTRKGR